MDAADAVRAFLDAMRAAGVDPDESIANALAEGGFVRFRCKDERKANGWARLFLDGRPAGRFGNHRLGIDERWKADAEQRRQTPAERLVAKRLHAEQRAARDAEKLVGHEAVARRAVDLLSRATPADPAHPYLLAKRVSGEGLVQSGDVLLAPMRDAEGRAWNAQRIFPDGTKLFLKGGRIDGLCWSIDDGDGPLCIGEGVGTMAAVRRATGYAVAASFSAANLPAVARILRQRWPDRNLIVCADDDAHLVNNPRIRRNLGVDAAKAAAAAIGARLAMPPRSTHHG